MPMIHYYWQQHNAIEPLSAADIAMATVLSITVIAGIAISIWIATKEL